MLMLVGCKSRQLSHAPAQGHAYPGRTTVFGSADSPYRMDEPWYAARNDAKPTVAAGVQSPTVQHSATRTYDRTHSYDGRVHDHYYRTRIDVRYRSTTQ
jgi:hypothetical protein